MHISLEDVSGHPIIKEAEIQIDGDLWPDVVFYNGKYYVFKYENFRRSDEDASIHGRIRIYYEKPFVIYTLNDKK